MEISRFIYQDNPSFEVEFEPAGSDNVMVNATQMARIFGKQVHEFVSNESTKRFIDVCLINGNSRLLNIEKRSDLIISIKNSGTWMHRLLALKFAAWLDPEFELWIYSTIDQILNHFFREQKDQRLEKLMLRSQLAQAKAELMKISPEFVEYLRLEQEELKAERKLAKIIKAQEEQLMLEFETRIKPEQLS